MSLLKHTYYIGAGEEIEKREIADVDEMILRS